jgi:acyl-coenzyme A synthetase/AMP-(fatty) acid ligase
MLDWLREHFSVNWWCADLGRAGGVCWGTLDSDWVIGQHYAVTLGLLGFCACIAYWPGGKYDETDGAGA